MSLVSIETPSPWALEGLVDTGCALLGAEQGEMRLRDDGSIGLFPSFI